MTEKKYLDQVYDLEARGGVEDLYDAWAQSYDEELTENGYATPARLARAMRLTGCTGPVLDIGCGTGLSGEALRAEGFDTIDGTDLSDGMLDVARAKGIYRSLWRTDPAAPLPVTPGDYSSVAAAGVVSPGAAPAGMLDVILDILAPGGRLAFSYNDHALHDPAYTAALARHLADGSVKKIHEKHGPHLPEIGLNSTVYVIEKT